ncbi:hypothetical protein HOY82DRAFT_513101 [Tuber indicum]|nr:hypothetical protein HOY82DRAFT_513101 [Tuber indicum]
MREFFRENRRFTGDSDRNIRGMRTPYSQMVSPTGSASNFQNGPKTPTGALSTTSSVDSPAMPETPVRSPYIGYPTPLMPCGHVSPGLGRICEKCADTTTACERWVSGVEEASSTYERGPPGFEPIPETPLAPTCEPQSSPSLSLEERERPLIGLGIEIPSAAYEEWGLLLTNPPTPPPSPPPPPPPPKRRKERPPPVLTARHLQRRFSWKFEKNCDTANATTTTPSSKRTGAIFAPPHVQNMSEVRSTFENFREMSCTLENCGRHGWDWATATAAGSDRDSCATLVASMHNEIASQSEGEQHLGGAYCAFKHCRRCQAGVGNRLELPRNRRCVAWIVDGLVAALTKGVGWLRGKGWYQ